MNPPLSPRHRIGADEDPNLSLGPRAAHLTRWLLCLTCFLSGAITLIIEIAGIRLLAPVFGNSLFTWTALIGVVLVSMSIGDVLGGFLVDRSPRLSFLGYLLLSASAWIVLVPTLNGWLHGWTVRAGIVSGPLFLSLLLFAVPACLLAAVGPFVVRLLSRTTKDAEIGLSAGLVGMLTTLGSFAGTLLTGFWLIPWFGVRPIFLLTGLTAASLGFTMFAWCRAIRVLTLVVAATSVAAAAHTLSTEALAPGVIYQVQTPYHELRVEESTTEHGDRIRSLWLDTTLEGGQYIETGGIYMTCNLYWRLAEVFCPRLESSLFLGGGGFAMPEDFARRHPHARIEVCELDSEVIEVGRRYFRLNEFPRVATTAGDARHFLASRRMRYDFVFGDAYQGVRHIPSHLITREFFSLVKSRLADDGLFLMNIISPLQGEQSQVFHSILKTVRTEFPYTQVYGVNRDRPLEPQNVIVMAATREPRRQSRPAAVEDVARFLLSTRLSDELAAPSGAMILTDDHNPADWMIAEQLLFHPPGVEPWDHDAAGSPRD